MNVISKLAKIYKDVRLVNCEIGDNALIADQCDLVRVKMDSHSEFGRRNLIRDCHIGYGSYSGHNTTMKNVEIGKYSSISWNVSIIGDNVHNYNHISNYSDYWFGKTFNVKLPEENSKSIQKTIIGNDVWIGCNSVILSGLKIGDGAVIGAGSVVTKNVDPYSIVAGNPATEIKKRFPIEIIDRLQKLQWWNLPPSIISDNIDLFRMYTDEDIIQKLERINKC